MFKPVKNFQALLATPFAGSTNALCWERALPGDYAEVVAKLGPGEGIVALDEDRLRGLVVSAKGDLPAEALAKVGAAVDQMLADLKLLRDAGRDPVLNIIYGYPRDEDGGPVPTDVLSWHVDSAPVEADTWLCTYHGAPSEGLLNEHAIRKVDDPKIRAELLKLYGEADDSAFTEWVTENHYDLHYAPKPGATPYSFGHFNLWRVTCAWPGSPVPPCVHRAPVTDMPRLLLIS
jgi:hypothetical protein